MSYRIDFYKPVHLTAAAALWAAVASSLHASMPWPAAAALAFVLTYMFDMLVDMTMRPRLSFKLRVGAGLAAALLGTVTLGLSNATLWATYFAEGSVARHFETEREATERNLMQVGSRVELAERNVLAWRDDAMDKARVEERDGGSCPARLNTRGVRGHVWHFRNDDAKVAKPLATELKALRESLNKELAALKALPRADTFADVRTAIDQANLGIDAALPLVKGGGFSRTALLSLESRKAAMLPLAGDSTGEPCGDAARMELIDKAMRALAELGATEAQPHLKASVDLSRPQDVTVRSWLRTSNLLASLVGAGSFKDDPLWLSARAANGPVNRESLSILMSAVLELCLIASRVGLRLRGTTEPPFESRLVEIVKRWSDAGANSGRRFVAQTLARAWCNLFYVPSSTSIPPAAQPGMASSDEVIDEGILPMPLGPIPQYSAKVRSLAATLLPYYDRWGGRNLIFIPLLPETRQAQAVASHLFNQRELKSVSSTATAADLALHPTAAQRLDAAIPGKDWRSNAIAIWAPQQAFLKFIDALEVEFLASPPCATAQRPGHDCQTRDRSPEVDAVDRCI